MLVTQFTTVDLQTLAQELLGFVEFPLGVEEQSQVVDRCQGAWMPVTQFTAADLQRLAQERLGLVEVSLAIEECAQAVN